MPWRIRYLRRGQVRTLSPCSDWRSYFLRSDPVYCEFDHTLIGTSRASPDSNLHPAARPSSQRSLEYHQSPLASLPADRLSLERRVRSVVYLESATMGGGGLTIKSFIRGIFLPDDDLVFVLAVLRRGITHVSWILRSVLIADRFDHCRSYQLGIAGRG